MERTIEFSNNLDLLVREGSGINFTEEPLPKLGVMALTLNGTQDEINEFVEGYLKEHPSTTAVSDAYFVGKRLPQWGDPNMRWDDYPSPDLYELTLIRKMQ